MKRFFHLVRRAIIASLIVSWIFTGTPQLWQSLSFPPKVQEARAVFSGIASRGSATLSGTGSTLAVSPTANLTAGKIVIVSAVSDNEDATDGATTFHSVSDTQGHTWNKVFEETETDGAADDGSTSSLWWTKVQTEIATTDSITLTLGASKSDAVIALVEATVASGNTVVALAPTPTHSTSGTSLSNVRSSLTSREYLFFGLFGAEGEDTAKTAITNYAEQHDLVSTTAGQAIANVQMHVGTRILTGTGDTWTSSAVTFTNGMQSLTAFYETASAAPTITVNQPDGTGDTIAQNANFTVNYNLADTDDAVTANFAYDADASGYDGTNIVGCTNRAEGTGSTCTWNTTGVTPGTYYVHGTSTDGATAAQDYSSGVVTINAAPTANVDDPDGTGDTVTVGDNYSVQYDLADTDDTVTMAFYYDTDSSGLNGTAISGACATAAEGTNVTCTWNTTGMTTGSYYVYGITNDGINAAVSDYSPGQITINPVGSLSVDIVDSGGSPVASPSVAMSTQAFSFALTTPTGTLGSANEKIRVTNTTATAPWSLTIGATSGSTAVWTTGSVTYDFNDPTASAGDGGDADSVGGQLSINPSPATITPQGGCSTTGISLGSSNAFSEGVTNSITLATASGSAQTGCYWDFTGIGLSQDIPAGQAVGTYTINFTLTAS
ncbi:MAG: hypothetical protein AAB490_01895 [Patescibacteria group bacterium]